MNIGKEEIINNYYELFKKKIGDIPEKDELFDRWMKELEKQYYYYLVMEDESYWERLVEYANKILEESIYDIKRSYITDPYLDELYGMYFRIKKLSYQKVLDSNITITSDEYDNLVEVAKKNAELVKEFNKEDAMMYLDSIIKNIKYILTDRIEEADSAIKNFYNLHHTNNKSHR